MSKESKHDHKATKFLKTIIFSMVMLAPFFAIGVKCWYVASNKNAKDSYTGNYSYLSTTTYSNYITTNAITYNNYEVNNLTYYYIENPNFSEINIDMPSIQSNSNVNHYVFSCNEITIQNTTYNNFQTLVIYKTSTNYYRFYLYDIIFNQTMYFEDQLFTTALIVNGNIYNELNSKQILSSQGITAKATLNNSRIYLTNNTINVKDLFVYTYLNLWFIDTNLSSVFYSSISELDKASIFSWTTETGTYRAVNNMCNGIGIVSPPLAVLITYWTLISIIYIIIDIVLETLIYLTHWINDKMI